MKYKSQILILSICLLLQVGCSSQAVYTEESFATDSAFKMRSEGDVALACESARRSLLGQGYLIESANSEGVKGRKAYKNDAAQSTFIEMNIVCLDEIKGSTLFATGLLSTYALKKSSSSASVGLSALGSISLPIGQSADSLVKVSEETIDDKEFYSRFFAAVSDILSVMQADRAIPEPAVEVPASEPIPTQEAPATAAEPVLSETEPPAQASPATLLEPFPVSVAPSAPEPVSSQEARETVLKPFPVRAAPAVNTLEPASSQEARETELKPFPVRAAPATLEPVSSQEVRETVLEPFPVGKAPANTSEPLPEQEVPAVVPESEPSQVPKAPASALDEFPDPMIDLY